MHPLAKTLLRISAVAAGLALLLPHSAAAQTGLGPTDHYKVYRLTEPITTIPPILLRDQFFDGEFQVGAARWFSPPAQKNQEQIRTPRFHLTWYDIFHPVIDPVRRVVVHNQFGSTDLEVRQHRFLLAPTVKNEPPLPLPFPQFPVNHFKCYDATGTFVVRTVTLVTQFGTEVVQVGRPELLCNPVQKTHLGQVTPIQHPNDHLVCYQIQPAQTLNATITHQDQFNRVTGVLAENRWLCVPSLKEIPTATEQTTWSRVRAQYR